MTSDEKLDKILEHCARQPVICEASHRRIENLEHTVYGNKRPGLVDHVRDLQLIAKLRGKAFWVAVGAIASGIVGWLVWGIKVLMAAS